MTFPSTILLADDEASFRESTAELLREDGYTCDAAPDAHQAAERLRGGSYDLVIADIRMPGNRRLEFVEQIRQLTPGLPVILVTGYPSTETAINSIHLPVAAYVTKPVDYGELSREIHTALAVSEGYRTIARVHDQLELCLDDLDRIRRHGGTRAARINGGGIQAPHSTLRCLAGCVSELVRLQCGPNPAQWTTRTCKLLDCPRLPYERNVLRQAIRLLNETKRRFKSKELGKVRELLDGLLAESD